MAPVVTATDNCDESPVVTMNETATSGCPYQITRTWVAVDACGNQEIASQVITVVDTEAPVLVGVPSDFEGECGSAPAADQVTATDNCDEDVIVTLVEEVIGEVCPLTVIRTWTATDACGNTASASQTITINDTTAPTFETTPAAEITVECDDVPTATVNDVIVADNCDLNPSVALNEVVIPGEPAFEGGAPCGYTIIRTWTATDLCLNGASFTQTVNVVDTTAPMLLGVPQNTTVECTSVPAPAVVTAMDNCFTGMIQVQFAEQIVPQVCGYQIIRTWTASDNCLNSVSASQTIQVVDTTDPFVVSTPMNVTIECDEELPTAIPTFDDACDANLDVTSNESIDVLNCGYVLTRVWTATDDCGNSVSTTQSITVVDTTDPILVGVPADAEVACDAIPTAAMVTASDNCDMNIVPTFAEEVIGGGCPYTIIRTWTAVDDCGNMVSESQTLTVVDFEAPVLVGVPANVTVDCNTIPTTAVVTATDNCSDNLVVSVEESIMPLQNCGYQIIRTWSVADLCGNPASATQIITVVDTEAPIVLTQPSDLTLSCDEMIPFVEPTFSDDCDNQLEVGYTEAFVPGDCPQNFSLIRTWIAIDDCGNDVTVVQNITVLDTTAPVLVGVPANTTAECDAIPAPAQVTATDNCDSAPQVAFNESNTDLACGYIITRTWTATDACGNTSSLSQTITVVDTTDPIALFVPQAITISCDEEVPSAEPIFTDNCDEMLDVMPASSIELLDCGSIITRSWTATDDCGNSITVSQTINVIDEVAPVLVGVPANATVECDAIPAPAQVSATDNCDIAPVVTLVEEVNGMGCPYTITRTWTATDNCGNTSTLSQTLTVTDTTAPVLVGVPANATAECDAIPTPAVVTATDNCAADLVVNFVESEEVLECGSIITRTWSVVDDCNNLTSASQVINVVDTTNPVLLNVPADATAECDNVPTPAVVTATDNCTLNLNVQFNEQTTNLECGYILTRTWSVADACGNTASASQIITVVDTTAPVIVDAPADATAECDNVPGQGMLAVTDNCDLMPTVTVSENVVPQECGYLLVRTYTASDDCGNSVTHIQTITVLDTQAPVITGVPANQEIECGMPIPAPGQVSVDDNCDAMPVVNVTEVMEALECGSQLVRTYTATDNCGNQSSVEQIITISDFTAPVFVDQPEDITVNCIDLTIAPTLTATDNCDNDVTITFNEVIGEGCPYVIERTWTATDDCGNSSTATQLVTVIDEEAPVFDEYPFFISLSCELVDDYMLTATDNCDADVEVVIIEELLFSGGCLGTVFRTYQATDACGNVTIAEQLIQRFDNTAPELFNVPENITVACGDEIPAPADDVFATDNCTVDVDLTFTEVQTNEFCPYDIIRTWTAVDSCGNETVGIQTISVTVETDGFNVALVTYPNPFDHRFNVEFTVPRDAQIIARVYDMTGREVLNVFEGKADARRLYQLGFDGIDWTPGAYILMMTVDGEIYNHRMIVTSTK